MAAQIPGERTKCFSIGDEGFTFPRRGRNGWAGPSQSELMRVGKRGPHHRSLGNYWVWRAGEIKAFWFFEPVESLGGRMAARKRGTNTSRVIRSLRDYVLCRRSFITPAENGHFYRFPFAFAARVLPRSILSATRLYFSYLLLHTGLCLTADLHIFKSCSSPPNIIITVPPLVVTAV